MKSSTFVVLGIIALLILGGCCFDYDYKPGFTDKQYKTASTHVSVISVGHWDKMKDTLTAGQFTLTPKDALGKVVPTTSLTDKQIMESLLAALKIGLQSNATTEISKKLTDKNNPDKNVDTTDETRTTGYIDPSEIKEKEDKEAEQYRSAKAEELRDKSIEMDPFMQYSAASALYQEVQLLNNYLKYAPKMEGFEPYLVRMQVSLLPRRRGVPVDAFTSISLFCEDEVPAEQSPQTINKNLYGIPIGNQPFVIPLLVTENLESSQTHTMNQKVRQFALSIMAMINQVGAQADLSSYYKEMESYFGQDLNSLLTVGRVTDNTIRVRLGAVRQGSHDKIPQFSMIPRTHNITLLVLVPKEQAKAKANITLASNTELYNTHTGERLQNVPLEESKNIVLSKFAELGLRIDTSKEPTELEKDFMGAASCILQNNLVKFRTEVKNLCKYVVKDDRSRCEKIDPLQMWIEMANFMTSIKYSYSHFGLPEPPDLEEAECTDFKPTPLVMLGSKKSSLVYVPGCKNIDMLMRIQAWLHLGESAAEPILTADSIEQEKTKFKIIFPAIVGTSLAKEIEIKNGQNTSYKAMCLQLKIGDKIYPYTVKLYSGEAPKTDEQSQNKVYYLVKHSDSIINIPHGGDTGDIYLQIGLSGKLGNEQKPLTTIIRIEKGDPPIVKLGSSTTHDEFLKYSEKFNAWEIIKSGRVKLTLSGLSENHPVLLNVFKVSDKNEETNVGKFKITVIRLPAGGKT